MDITNYKKIPGVSSHYLINENGDIVNTEKGIKLKPQLNNKGYYMINLQGTIYLIHRLVALTYIPNPDNLPEVNHKDENPLNNNVSNLEWCTHKYNIRYTTAKKVYQYDTKGNLIKKYDCISDVNEDGFDAKCVSKCCINSEGRVTYKGFIWSNIELSKEDVRDIINKNPNARVDKTISIGLFAKFKK